jgi:hypothetical protein
MMLDHNTTATMIRARPVFLALTAEPRMFAGTSARTGAGSP